MNSSIVNEEHCINEVIDSNEKNQGINVDNFQNANDETEETLVEERNVDGIGNQVQNVHSFENDDTSEISQIKHPEKAGAQLYNLKKNKKVNSNNNPALQMLEIMKENAALRKKKREENIIKPKVPTVFENMDETDIFFLSMSKMIKQLPQVEQAKIKLLLSNSVLQAEIRNTSAPTVSLPIPSPILSEAATSSSQYSTMSSEESQLHYKPTIGEMLNMSHELDYFP